jgi:hypothetical protein
VFLSSLQLLSSSLIWIISSTSPGRTRVSQDTYPSTCSFDLAWKPPIPLAIKCRAIILLILILRSALLL